MSKQHPGRFRETQAAAAHLQRAVAGSLVIEHHRELLGWCVSYAWNRQRDQVRLRDLPDDVFAALQASEGALVEGLTALYVCANPPTAVDIDALAAVLQTASGAVNLEALRRAGELELSD